MNALASTAETTTPDLSPAFACAALADDAALERDLADDRRALLESAVADFDPLGLYRLEQERDLAADLLAEAFPNPDITLSLNPIEYRHRIDGTWSVETRWQASAEHLYVMASTPTQAVNAVIRAHARANPRTRQHSESRLVVAVPAPTPATAATAAVKTPPPEHRPRHEGMRRWRQELGQAFRQRNFAHAERDAACMAFLDSCGVQWLDQLDADQRHTLLMQVRSGAADKFRGREMRAA